jgi:transposase, IS6 family
VLLSLFNRRRFPDEIILLCVRWYCKYGISYRDLAEMMQERGVEIDLSTVFRWAQRIGRTSPQFPQMTMPYSMGACRSDERDRNTVVTISSALRGIMTAVGCHVWMAELSTTLPRKRSRAKLLRRERVVCPRQTLEQSPTRPPIA